MKILFSLLLLILSQSAIAEQFKQIKDLEVHYSAFNSTLIPAKVTRQYQIKRSGYNALINVTMLDRSQAGKPAITGIVKGTAKNLLGTIKPLKFKEIKESTSVYYIAELPFVNEELYSIKIDVSSGLKGSGTITFNQKFYVE
ncbi:DUF4426 domain-containing protein [Aliivibrio kagoshimensis]|uniref:DUF4426 domain-containing protein n=1 Tax=Aliivibrio kagoshimensis TaxID=2910230 RepID=UPI003D114419